MIDVYIFKSWRILVVTRSSQNRDCAWTLNTARSFKLRLLNNVWHFCNGLFIQCNCSLKISRTELHEEDPRFSQLPVMFFSETKAKLRLFVCSQQNASRETTKVTGGLLTRFSARPVRSLGGLVVFVQTVRGS